MHAVTLSLFLCLTVWHTTVTCRAFPTPLQCSTCEYTTLLRTVLVSGSDGLAFATVGGAAPVVVRVHAAVLTVASLCEYLWGWQAAEAAAIVAAVTCMLQLDTWVQPMHKVNMSQGQW